VHADGSTIKTCVDTSLDENHCGGCNKPCPGGTFVRRKCLIDCGTTTRCGTQCFDTTTDDLHCGQLHDQLQALRSGVLRLRVQDELHAALHRLQLTCVNPANDDLNCGGCNKPCGAKQACVASVCKNLVENCLNGIDDDRDNLIDCADP
jgi:hypothetical protein